MRCPTGAPPGGHERVLHKFSIGEGNLLFLASRLVQPRLRHNDFLDFGFLDCLTGALLPYPDNLLGRFNRLFGCKR